MVNRNIYQTLATPTSIRLLHLHAGTEDGKVHCSLSVHEFEEAPKYEALSYVWGQSGGTKTIWVDKVRLDIGENLFDALGHCLFRYIKELPRASISLARNPRTSLRTILLIAMIAVLG